MNQRHMLIAAMNKQQLMIISINWTNTKIDQVIKWSKNAFQGVPGDRLSSTARVKISVTDENDNYPQFSQKTYNVEVQG